MSTKEEKEESFICNLRTGEFLGRTICSWALILGFYLVFYAFLAGLFYVSMWVMLQTLDEHVPKYRDRVASPGLVIRPHDDYSGPDIYYSRSEPESYDHYVRQLDRLLEPYSEFEQQSNELCLAGEYTMQEHQPKRVCQFQRSALRQCSGLADRSYGYADGNPCILVKMNRVIGLMPRGDPYINCTVKTDSSPMMRYFPSEGRIDKMYFPYYGKRAQPKYVQPLVAVKLMLEQHHYGRELGVECRVEGSDLPNHDHRDRFLGRVSFKITVSE